MALNPQTAESIDGAITNEGGAYLAWTNAEGVTPGPIQSVEGAASATRWTPSKSGDYIFRRSIDTTNTADTAYTYAGYHYDQTTQKYYKIVIGTDTYPVSGTAGVYDISANEAQLGVAVDNVTGELKAAPKIRYVEEKKVENAKVTLTHQDKSASNPERLVATYSDATKTSTSGFDASAEAARAEVEYRNAQGAYNSAKSRYDQALADFTYADAMVTAYNKLLDAADKRKAEKAANDGAQTVSDTAQETMNKAVLDDQDTSATGDDTGLMIDFKDIINITDPNNAAAITDWAGLDSDMNISAYRIVPKAVRDILDADHAKAENERQLTECYKNFYGEGSEKGLEDLWGDIKTYSSNIKGNLTTISTATDPTAAETALTNLRNNINSLNDTLTAYKAKFAGLVTAAGEEHLTGLDTSAVTATTAAIQAVADKVKKSSGGASLSEKVEAANTGLAALIADYRDKYDTYQEYSTAGTGKEAKSQEAWTQAITDYNNAVGKPSVTTPAAAATGATLNYETDVNASQTQPNNYTAGTLTNNAATLVPQYSAVSTANATNPQIASDADFTPFAYTSTDPNAANAKVERKAVLATDTFKQLDTAASTSASDEEKAYGVGKTEKQTVDQLKNAMDNAKSTLDANATAYTDAVSALTAGSTITIYINLADDDNTENTAWTYNPASNGTTEADFYLNKILAPAETSEKLITSVELADTVTASDYKNLIFDLNVGLDSAQITYADDQRTITDDAVKANDAFKVKVDNNGINQSTKAVTWKTT